MNLEYEFRYPPDAFDRREIVRRLEAAGAELERTLLYNAIYASDSDPELYVRLRRVYSSLRQPVTVLTVKRLAAGASIFDEEYETEVADGAMAHQILSRLGCSPKYVVEKLRDVVRVPDASGAPGGLGEVSFDEFVGLPPSFALMEIESPTRAKLDALAKLIGLAKPTAEQLARAQANRFYLDAYGVDTKKAGASGALKDLTFTPGDVAALRRLVAAGGSSATQAFDRAVAGQLRRVARLSKKPLRVKA